MNKDFLVTLLQKDIKELSLLTEGFEKMDEFPTALIRLAKDKAENILISLNELGNTATTKPRSDTFIYEEKNSAVSPSESDYEPIGCKTDEKTTVEKQSEIAESEKNEFYIETGHLLDKATGTLDDVSVNTDSGVSLSLPVEEFQEEIEVEEISENEQILMYKEPKIYVSQDTEVAKSIEIEPKQEIENEKSSQNIPTLNEILSRQDNNSLSDSLANQKINDIRQAMNIGDRFRFQRELFGGNGEVMNKTIAYLNQLAKYEEAVSFLKSKFGWSNDNQHAEDFLQILKRRF